VINKIKCLVRSGADLTNTSYNTSDVTASSVFLNKTHFYWVKNTKACCNAGVVGSSVVEVVVGLAPAGTDVMILKIFSQKKLAKILAFFDQAAAIFAKI
jgi:hypothetical protein